MRHGVPVVGIGGVISVVLICNDNSSEAIEHALQIGSACLTVAARFRALYSEAFRR